MPTRTQVEKTAPQRTEEAVAEVKTADPAEAERRTEHLADLDAMLDEIDEVLEENAEEFVAAYVQKGGQ